MNKYETMFLFSLKNGEEAVTEAVEKMKNLVSANGTLESVDEWGKRKLAYAIEDETEGYYVLMNYTCNPDFPAELDRIVKITDGILRALIIKK